MGPGLPLGVGDDCALLEVASGHVLAVSVDTLVAGVHFFSDQPPESIGHKAVAAALSDLAAMGARPLGILLALTLPRIEESWLRRLADGVRRPLDSLGIPLVGGDTTRGPLALSVTVLGEIRVGQELRRCGASPGDLVVVSGTLGGAAGGLQLAMADPRSRGRGDLWSRNAMRRYLFPEARISLGLALAGRANAAIDISDGLLSDLGHLCNASGCGACIQTAAIPQDPSLAELSSEMLFPLVVAGGDDYEIVFAWPETERSALESLAIETKLPLTVIGRFTEGTGIELVDRDGCRVQAPESTGYEHFVAAGAQLGTNGLPPVG